MEDRIAAAVIVTAEVVPVRRVDHRLVAQLRIAALDAADHIGGAHFAPVVLHPEARLDGQGQRMEIRARRLRPQGIEVIAGGAQDGTRLAVLDPARHQRVVADCRM
jgi:hypothetical protein